MADKMTCPGCDSRTSAVWSAVRYGDPCPYCGLPADAIAKVETVRRSQADETLRVENERLIVENGNLTAERDRLARKVELIRQAMEGDSDGF